MRGDRYMSLLTTSWLIVLGVVILALIYVGFNYFRIKKMPEGTADMIELSGIIRSGAQTFLKTEYKSICIVVAVVAVIFTLFVEKTSGITFLMGVLCKKQDKLVYAVCSRRSWLQYSRHRLV